ncbi:MAG: hypothetical protein ACLR8Y_15625 [Alistipes indistinctus]
MMLDELVKQPEPEAPEKPAAKTKSNAGALEPGGISAEAFNQ